MATNPAPLEVLLCALEAQATERGWKPRRDPPELLRAIPRPVHLAAEFGTMELSSPTNSPATMRALAMGDLYSVLLWPIAPEMITETDVVSLLTEPVKHAAIQRTWLSSGHDDLYLFCIGIPGSDELDTWVDRVHLIERDDRVCRKLAWLPPKDPKKYADSLERFLGRTFLARPWQGATHNQAQIDPIAHAMLAGSKIPQSWGKTLLEPGWSAGAELAEQLIRDLEGNNS